MCLSSCVAEILTAAYTSLPTHNNPGQHSCASPSGRCQPPSNSCCCRHIWLIYQSGNALVCWTSHSYLGKELVTCWGQPWGQSFLHYEPDVSGRMGKQGRWIKWEKEQAREKETMLSLPFLYLFLFFLAHGALKALWEWGALLLPLRLNQLLLNWIVS